MKPRLARFASAAETRAALFQDTVAGTARTTATSRRAVSRKGSSRRPLRELNRHRRLHSYPDWFRFHVTRWHGFRQIGNSVPPLVARAIAARIAAAIGLPSTRPVNRIGLGEPRLLSFSMTEARGHYGVTRAIPSRVRES